MSDNRTRPAVGDVTDPMSVTVTDPVSVSVSVSDSCR
jgi:hypothetical protein